MDKTVKIPLSKILFDSKENIQLYSEKRSTSSPFEQVQETNFHVQFKKKYGIKNKDDSYYKDLNNIQKQLTLLSNITNNNSNYNCCNSINKYCNKYSQKMLPESIESINYSQKDACSSEHSSECKSMANVENNKEDNNDRDLNKSPASTTTQKSQFLNNKSTFPQHSHPVQMTFSLNKESSDHNGDIGSKNKKLENESSAISFTESQSRKPKHGSGNNDAGDDDDDDDDDDNGDEDREDKLLKCRPLNYTAFEFDGDYSKDLDSSGLFEFSLEGEKIVSSLCGPQMKSVNKIDRVEETESNKFFIINKPSRQLDSAETFKGNSTIHKMNNGGALSKQLDAGMSFKNAITSTPEKDNSDIIYERNIIHNKQKTVKQRSQKTTTEFDETSAEKENLINRYAGGDKSTVDGDNPNEMKCVILQQMSTNCVEMRSGTSYGTWMIGRIRPIENKESREITNELCSQLKDSMQSDETENSFNKNSPPEKQKSDVKEKTNKSISSPNIFSALSRYNQGDNSSGVRNSEALDHKAEEKVKLIDSCDDEISFRKTAIKGCLAFERIIKDLNIVTQEQDLENYCKTVKRCVSVANSIESHEYTVLISELITGFLKLADSWGILNSYFGESGNYEYKSQNLNEINFYQSFQDWQIKSRILLDHLTTVVQNLKEFIPKTEEKGKFLKETQIPQYNPFFNSNQQNSGSITTNKTENSNLPLMQPLQKEENTKQQMSSQLQLPEIQFPKNIANIFTAHNQNNNWKHISESCLKKPAENFWELPQNNQPQNTFNPQSISERKLRKKWTLTMPEFQSEPQCPLAPSQGITIQPTPGTGQIPAVNFQYGGQNKGQMDNMLMQPISFFGNQCNPVQHSIQTMRESPAFNYARPPTYYPNLKQSPKKKSNATFKPEDHFPKDIINNSSVYNRVNMCNPQLNIPLLPNNVSPNPFGIMEEPKSNVIYQNFCIGDTKTLSTNNVPYGAHFFHSEMYQGNPVANQSMFCHKTCDSKPVMPTPLNNGDCDDSSEEYYPIKSYMKPGSYRVPNKSKPLLLQATNNLNYIFDDVLVTGITVPFTKTNVFSQSKKTTAKTVSTIEKSIQTNRSDEMKNTDLAWKAALASAEVLGKSLVCKQNENSTSPEKAVSKKIKEAGIESSNISENKQMVQSRSTDTSSDQNKDDGKQSESDAVKPTTIKTDDWLIQSFSKLEGQSESKDVQVAESDRSNETNDSKANSSNTKNESDDSDYITNDIDSECQSAREKGKNKKKDRNNPMKQKHPSNMRSVSILQKPREYCQSRSKPWDKARDFSYQLPPHKGDTRPLHKSPANWIKYNRKCINRQTLFKLQDILNNLSKMESSNIDTHKEFRSKNEPVCRIININAINYKLKSHIYENVDQILIDIRQMFANSKEINKEYSNIIELTKNLELLFDELIEKHFGQPDSSDIREATHHSGSSQAIKHRRTQKVQRK